MARLDAPLRLTAGLILLAVAGACSVPPPVRPSAQSIEKIGVVTGVTDSQDRTTYTFADGSAWDRPNDEYRLIYDLMGRQTLFVAGTDPDGTYVLLVGSQDGLPAECAYALRYGGREWGEGVESQGLLWPKAEAFTGLAVQPTVGTDYPGNAGFCLDDRGQVTSVYLAEPGSDSPSPVGSATAP